VTACALKFFPSFEILEMDFVVERDFIELHLTFQKSFIVASFSEATVIPNLCPGFGFYIKFCPVAAYHDQPFDFFSQLGLDASPWGIMTHAALDIFMRRRFPTIKIRFHKMARGAKV